ncbi:MAG TPA: zinc-binding dehydrogenase [Chloroflexota bacterium]|nr:zinc-binding dehydrogenase [Chloroflexota bacterium]
MRAVRMHATGGPDVLQLEEIPTPESGRNEVLVRLRVATVNRVDLLIREGQVTLGKGLPHTLGVEGAGAVVRGSGGDARPGDRVFVSGDTLGRLREGTYAEYVIVPNSLVVPIPKEIQHEDAAALGIAALTAWQALVDRANIQSHQSVLIHAAGSGVGVYAVQIAKLLGVRVIATAGSDGKLERARQLGADQVINYNRSDLVAQVRSLTHNRGIDVVLDPIGGSLLTHSLECIAPNGKLVVVGSIGGDNVDVDLRRVIPLGISVLGLNAGALPPYQAADRYRQLLDLVLNKRLHPVVDRVLPLAEAAAAHRRLAQRSQFGKILLKT